METRVAMVKCSRSVDLIVIDLYGKISFQAKSSQGRSRKVKGGKF